MSYQQGICECTNHFDVCLDVWFCAPCQAGRQWHAVKGFRHSMDCCCCLLSMPFFYIVVPMLRCEVSNKYGLGEQPITSCCLGALCPTLSLCQMNHELNVRGVNPGGCCCAAPDLVDPSYNPMVGNVVVVHTVSAQPGVYGGSPMLPPPGAVYGAPMYPPQPAYPPQPGGYAAYPPPPHYGQPMM